MSWAKLFKAATKPAPKPARQTPVRVPKAIGTRQRQGSFGIRDEPVFREDWDAFATPYKEAAKDYLKQARSFQRIKEARATDADLAKAKQAFSACSLWAKGFEKEFDTFDLDSDAAINRATTLYDKVFEAEGELEDALRHIEGAIEWQNDPDNPDNED